MKSGIDCAGLVVRIAREFGLELKFDDYTLKRGADPKKALSFLRNNGFREVSFERAQVGDLLAASFLER